PRPPRAREVAPARAARSGGAPGPAPGRPAAPVAAPGAAVYAPGAMEDTQRFAFREQGAWQVEPERMAWRRGVDALRRASQARVPEWVRARRLPPVRRFAVAGARVGSALVGWRLRERRRGGEASRAGLSRRLRRAFEHLGPSYIKLGQIVSSGQGLFPDE